MPRFAIIVSLWVNLAWQRGFVRINRLLGRRYLPAGRYIPVGYYYIGCLARTFPDLNAAFQ
jgi:hypothetical protein